MLDLHVFEFPQEEQFYFLIDMPFHKADFTGGASAACITGFISTDPPCDSSDP